MAPTTALAAPPTSVAALTVKAVHSTLCGASVENTVRRSLRDGDRLGLVTSADERAAVASAVFGTSVMRAKLSWMLASTGAVEHPSPAASLLATFLLHEPVYRVRPGAMAAVLPVASLGLSEEALARLAAADEGSIRWPRSAVDRLASRYSLPCGLARPWLSQLGEAEAMALATALNQPGPVTLRTNPKVLGRASLLTQLGEAGVPCRAGALSPWAITLDASEGRTSWGGSVWNLPMWREGAFEVRTTPPWPEPQQQRASLIRVVWLISGARRG